MTRAVQQLLESFESLTEAEKQEATAEVLRRSLQSNYAALSDEAFIEMTEQLFLDLDAREAADAQP